MQNFLRIALLLCLQGCVAPQQDSKNEPVESPVLAPTAKVSAVTMLHCAEGAVSCQEVDAIVFVHGIYGDEATFTSNSGFAWPKNIPKDIGGRKIDVYSASYRSQLLSWARGNSNSLSEVTNAFYLAMEPVRAKRYRSIGFIAHSLGGNVVATYIHKVKTLDGHINRARNAYVITLGTPLRGSAMADIGGLLKSVLGMRDPLLSSLKSENIYLDMLAMFRRDESLKSDKYKCRPLHVYAGYETETVAGLTIVPSKTAIGNDGKLFYRSPMPFAENHITISKPLNDRAPVYVWVDRVIEEEMSRLTEHARRTDHLPENRQICEDPDNNS